MPDKTETVFYVGPGPDGLEIPLPDGTVATAVRDGDGVTVPAETAKSLLAREDFQKSKPTRQTPKVETTEDQE